LSVKQALFGREDLKMQRHGDLVFTIYYFNYYPSTFWLSPLPPRWCPR
jgi:hypothetical protein